MTIVDQAQAAANLRYDGQQSAIQRRLDALRAGVEAGRTSINEMGTAGRGQIGEVYDILGSKLGENRAAAMEGLNLQADRIGQGYRDASQMATAARDDATAYLANLVGQTCLENQAGLNQEAQSGVVNTTADILGRNAQAEAGATGDLRTWAGKHDAILGQGQDIGEATRAQSLSRYETELMAALSNLELEGQKGANELDARLIDMLSEKGNFLSTEYGRLAAEQWQRDLEQAKMAQQAAMANAELAYKRDALAASQAESARNSASGDERWKAEMALKERAQALAEKAAGQGESGLDPVMAGIISDQVQAINGYQYYTPEQKASMIAEVYKQYAPSYFPQRNYSPTELSGASSLGSAIMRKLRSSGVGSPSAGNPAYGSKTRNQQPVGGVTPVSGNMRTWLGF